VCACILEREIIGESRWQVAKSIISYTLSVERYSFETRLR